MTQIKINIDEVTSNNIALKKCNSEIEQIASHINRIRTTMLRQTVSSGNTYYRLSTAYRQLDKIQANLWKLSNNISASAEAYRANEIKLKKECEKIMKSTLHKSSNRFLAGTPQWFNESSWTQLVVLMKLKELTSKMLEVISKMVLNRLPKVKIDGKYLKMLNNGAYKGGQNIARWYTIKNILLNKYSKATSMFVKKITARVALKYLAVLSAVETFADEYNKDPNLSQERRVGNASVEVGLTLGSAYAGAATGAATGAAVGAFVGSVVPVAGTAVVGAVGGVVGAVVGIGVSFAIDAVTNIKVFDNGQTSTRDAIKNFVGEGLKMIVAANNNYGTGHAISSTDHSLSNVKTSALSLRGGW